MPTCATDSPRQTNCPASPPSSAAQLAVEGISHAPPGEHFNGPTKHQPSDVGQLHRASAHEIGGLSSLARYDLSCYNFF